LAAGQPFLHKPLDLVVQSCAASGFLGGHAGNASIVKALHERAGATVVGAAEAMEQVLRRKAVAETTVVTPYLAAVNAGLHEVLGEAGFLVETLDSF
jgi:maleate cis-trans isomerase